MDLPNDPSTPKSPRVVVHRRKRFQDFAVAVRGCFKESKDSVDKSRFNPGVLVEVFCENGSSDKYVHFFRQAALPQCTGGFERPSLGLREYVERHQHPAIKVTPAGS